MDWHIHTRDTSDIAGTDVNTLSNLPKAFGGFNSLHWGRHVFPVPGTDDVTRGDVYCLQCVNAFVLDRPEGLNLNLSGTEEQPLALSFWHIIEMCDHECFTGFVTETADEFVAVQLRADLEFGLGTNFGPWERIEPNINPYDGVQDTLYFTPSYEPGDDINPLSQEDRETTMCSPLFTYLAQGSAKGISDQCQDGDNNGFNDCGSIAAKTNPAERRPDRVARGNAGVGVWAFTSVSLDRYAGRHVQIRYITSTLDGRDVFDSYLETTSTPFNPPSASFDDGWYIDDVKISGLIPQEIVFSIDLEDGTATCPLDPTTGQGASCAVIGANIVASTNSTGATGATVELTAEGVATNCVSGETRVRWLANGAEVKPLSTDFRLVVAPRGNTTYTAELSCSSNPGCSASASTTVAVYDGATGESIVLAWVAHSAPILSFDAVSQLELQGPGMFPGYDVFCGMVRSGTPPAGCSGTGLVNTGTGLATDYGALFSTEVQQTPGTPIPVANTDVIEPAVGNSLFYLAGHAFPTPENLGFTSNRSLRQNLAP
ncbi:MAG: hypothetical protein O7F16_08455 [Acidobacteria bacterium]|nr:hypothetical protein [Acidobacteriota bacterium]